VSVVPPPPFPLLEIVSFVDATTVVVVGPRVEELRDNDELYVLGIGKSIVPKTNVPLISSKATLVVTFPAGPYALARTPAVTIDTGPFGSMAISLLSKTTVSRRPLTSDEKLFLGDPGKEPVQIGDKVIRKSDLMAFIRYRAELGET
jgi:hypothetical protein